MIIPLRVYQGLLAGLLSSVCSATFAADVTAPASASQPSAVAVDKAFTPPAESAGFIKANMPLGLGGTLTDQQAWDVATYMDSQERPQDPRYTGSVALTRQNYHNTALSMYGEKVNGHVLGQP